MSHSSATRDNNGLLIVPALVVMLALWLGGIVHWLNTGDLLGFMLLGYLGLIAGLGVGGYVALPDRFRPYGRKITMFLVGVLLLVIAILSDHGNMQIEGFFFALFAGIAPYILLHFAIAKFVGPLLFGRIWCGWACWYGMIFDMLPYPFSHYRQDKRLNALRYLHFALSLGIVALLWFGLGFEGALGRTGLYGFLLGISAYYVVGIAMALVFKDNRAFCKYLCPISVPLKAVSRFSLLKIEGSQPEKCGSCEACVEMCPMNIRIKDYVQNQERVLSTECVMCLTCLNVCPHDSLTLSFKWDVGGREYWDHDPSKGNKQTVPNVAWLDPADEALKTKSPNRS